MNHLLYCQVEMRRQRRVETKMEEGMRRRRTRKRRRRLGHQKRRKSLKMRKNEFKC